MSAPVRTWKPYGEGSILSRDGEPDQGPAIRAYATPNDAWGPDDNYSERVSWSVTAESPFGAVDLARGTAEDLDDARDQAQAALVAIAGTL